MVADIYIQMSSVVRTAEKSSGLNRGAVKQHLSANDTFM